MGSDKPPPRCSGDIKQAFHCGVLAVSVLGTQRGGVGRGEKASLLAVGKGPGDSEAAHRPGVTGLAPQLRDELILGNRNNLRWRREPGIKGAARSGDRGSAQQVFFGGQGQASTPPALSTAFPALVLRPITLSTLFPGNSHRQRAIAPWARSY